jgi:hypothetical protein
MLSQDYSTDILRFAVRETVSPAGSVRRCPMGTRPHVPTIIAESEFPLA